MWWDISACAAWKKPTKNAATGAAISDRASNKGVINNRPRAVLRAGSPRIYLFRKKDPAKRNPNNGNSRAVVNNHGRHRVGSNKNHKAVADSSQNQATSSNGVAGSSQGHKVTVNGHRVAEDHPNNVGPKAAKATTPITTTKKTTIPASD